jgi:hypothetical protein
MMKWPLPAAMLRHCTKKKPRKVSVRTKNPWPGTDPLWSGTMLELFKAQGFLYIPSALTLTISALCPQCIYVLRQW